MLLKSQNNVFGETLAEPHSAKGFFFPSFFMVNFNQEPSKPNTHSCFYLKVFNYLEHLTIYLPPPFSQSFIQKKKLESDSYPPP